MIGNEKLNKIALAGVILFLYLTFIFGRSFIGLYIFWISFRRINNRIFTYLYPPNIFH